MIRARGRRRESPTWPGFVDAMTGLLLVLMFVLTVFTVVQFALRDQITGQQARLSDQDARLTDLTAQVASLTDALGLARGRAAGLSRDLQAAAGERDEAEALVASLTQERESQAAALDAAGERISGFEAQVAGLLAERAAARGRVADLEAQVAEQGNRVATLDAALAAQRTETDRAAEEARLAAARADALDALARSLQGQGAVAGEALTDAEAQRVADAAAADALRQRLRDSEAELTALSLSLEEERQRAEDTLTLLAAAEGARDDLDIQLAAAVLARSQAEGRATAAEARAGDLDARLLAALSLQETTQGELDAARARLADAQGEGEELNARLAAALSAGEATAGELQAARAALDEAIRAADVGEREAQARLAQAVLDQQAAEAARDEAQGRADASEAARGQAEAGAARAGAERDDLATRLAVAAAERDRLSARLAEAVLSRTEAEGAAARAAEAAGASDAELRARLADALERVAAAEAEGQVALSEADRQAALLATAQAELAGEREAGGEARRQVAALNAQVAELRSQVGTLQALLQVADDADAAAQVQIESLGSQLNTALARVAQEERARAELAEAERLRLQAEAQDLAGYRSEFFGNVRRAVEGREGVAVRGDRFVFSSDVVFPSGSAELSPEGRAQVARVGALLRELSSEIPPDIDWVIQVDGHTDDTGDPDVNWQLSQQRALSVVRQLSDEEGIDPSRLSANGFGEFQPVDPADTPEARARNRRIEIKLTER